MNMIITYDIADHRRLNKVAKILKDYGYRVQKSIFEATINAKIIAEMKSRIEDIILEDEDGVKYFHVCEKCENTLEIIGHGVFIDPDEEYYIF